MRTAGAPKLLFHGTAAMASHFSYMVGGELVGFYQKNPKAALKLIADKESSRRFERFGPGYPCTGRATTTYNQEVCLTSNFVDAFCFSDYKGRVVDPCQVQLQNSRNSRIHISTANYLHFPRVQEFLSRFTQAVINCYEQALGGSTFNTPGAIIIVNGPQLQQSGLMIDQIDHALGRAFFEKEYGEETANARYLPWEFIRGVLYVQPDPPRITSFWFRDSKIQDDLNAYLRELRFKIDIMPCRGEMDRSVAQWQRDLPKFF